MKRILLAWAVVSLLALGGAWAQETRGPDSAAATPNPAATAVPRLVKFSGMLTDAADKPLTGPVEVTFSIYKSQTDPEPLWQETQTVEAGAGGQYTALLGAMSEQGLPVELFASGEARWLGVTAGKLPEQARVLLVSVPYALKAGDAATLGGKPASAFVQAAGAGTSVETGGASGAAVGVQDVATAGASTSGTPKSKANPEQTTTTSTVVTPGGTANYLSKFSAAATIVNSAVFESGGKVGIGTATPGSTLAVTTRGAPLPTIGTTPILATFGSPSGTVPWALKQNAAASATPSLMWFETADGNLGWIGAGGTATMAMGGLSGNALALYSNSTRRMFFDTTGHVGIGTSTPLYTLDVTGNIRSTTTVTAAGFSGNGSGLTNLNPANLSLGTAAINITGTAATATNALALGGVAASGYATVGANSFTGNQAITGNLTVSGTISQSGAVMSAGLNGIKEFLANGTFTVPAGITRLMVEMWGGGGGGGGEWVGSPSSGFCAWYEGGSGGSGAYTRDVIAVTPGATYSVVVGAGGAGATTGNGGNAGGSQVLDPNSIILVFAGGGQGGLAASSAGDGASGAGGQVDANAPISHSQNAAGFIIPPSNVGAGGIGGAGVGGNTCTLVNGSNGYPGYVLLIW